MESNPTIAELNNQALPTEQELQLQAQIREQ